MSGEKNVKKIRTRIAPSPTGPMHAGTARSALFNFVFARQNGGDFILRIEDTDLERSNPVFENDIRESLEWLGLKWDEFYRQSERTDIYEKYLQKMAGSKIIFWCSHSEDELTDERKAQLSRKEVMRHVCSHRNGGGAGDEKEGILRFKNDFSGDVVFDDAVRGKISFDARLLGDFSVAKDLRTPLYNFAVVIDDFEMAITHVIRGEDHISNTPKQILLQEALGFSRPIYAHLPLILGSDRSKLSKRHGAKSVLEYQKTGYLPEAMLNFLILLGWHPLSKENGKEKEIFTMDEILKEFSLSRVQKGGAIFDTDKLNWLNRKFIRTLKPAELAEKLLPFAGGNLAEKIKENPDKWLKIAVLSQERLTSLNEIGDMAETFYQEPFYSKELLFWKENQPVANIVRHLEHIRDLLSGLSAWNKKELENEVAPYAQKEGRGETLWPLRTALSGKRHSAGPFEIAEILGKVESVKRIEKAIKMLAE